MQRALEAKSEWRSAFRYRLPRSSAFYAMNAWQYAVGSNRALYELGIKVWRRIVARVPVRPHLLVCDPGAASPLALPAETRVLTTSVAEAELEHFDEVLATATSFAATPEIDRVFAAMSRDRDHYEYRLVLNPRDVTDPRNAVFVRFALQPRIAGLVTRHLGAPCHLSEIKLFVDRPTTTPPRASQHWHRDPEDWSTVTVFVYLSDVGPDSAPFCYVPWNESLKLYGRTGWFRDLGHRLTPDELMEKAIPRSSWVEATGPVGTVVFIDSAACFHRGKRAESNRRLCLQLLFTSTLSRMDLQEPQSYRLLRQEFERRHRYESPRYSVASSAPAP